MTVAKAIEYRIIRQLLAREPAEQAPPGPWLDRLIAVLAVTAALLTLGAYLPELVLALLAGSTVAALSLPAGGGK
ncbi:MAG: hypothetical protein R3228_05285 [Halioglobus sp.]|nr:hypothetical protein [Halioglobus sp.]